MCDGGYVSYRNDTVGGQTAEMERSRGGRDIEQYALRVALGKLVVAEELYTAARRAWPSVANDVAFEALGDALKEWEKQDV